jgi:competence protein ComEA
LSEEPRSTEPRRPPPDPSWRERVADAAQHLGVDMSARRVAVAAFAVVAAVAVALFVLRPWGSSPAPDDALPLASSVGPPSLSSGSGSGRLGATSTTLGEIVVQAAGAVVKPGVYTIASSARVNDLIAAAGGFAADADPDQVELAATLSDGERVYVPKMGESPPAASGSRSGGAPGSPSVPSTPVDLNHASAAELETLPGIGPALAQAIVDYRSAHGAFQSIDDLGDVRGIGPAKLEQLRPLVKV